MGVTLASDPSALWVASAGPPSRLWLYSPLRCFSSCSSWDWHVLGSQLSVSGKSLSSNSQALMAPDFGALVTPGGVGLCDLASLCGGSRTGVGSSEPSDRPSFLSFPDPERWTNIPLLVKILKLIINELSNVMEANAARQAAPAEWGPGGSPGPDPRPLLARPALQLRAPVRFLASPRLR